MTQQPTTVVKTLENLLLSLPPEITYNNDKSKTKIDEKDPWFLWKQCQFFTKKIRQAKEKNDITQELGAIIDLGEVYISQKLYGEAYHEMMLCKTRAEQIVQQQFCPTVDYLYAKCMYLLSHISFNLERDDTEEYLQSACVRTEELLCSINPNNIPLNIQLISDAKLLLGKIRIGQGAVLMKKKMFSNAAERFVEAANLVLDQKKILNFKMYREICFQIASCLQEMDAPELGIEYVKRGQNIPLEEGDNEKQINNRAKDLLDNLNKMIKKKTEQKNQTGEQKPQNICELHKESDSEDLDWGLSDDDTPVGLLSKQNSTNQPTAQSEEPQKKDDKSDDDSEELDWGLSDDDNPTPSAVGSSSDTKKESTTDKKDDKKELLNEESSDENWGIDEDDINPGGDLSALRGLISFEEPKKKSDPIQQELFPEDYRFFQPRSFYEQKRNIKPSTLFTIKLDKNDKDKLHDISSLKKWLYTIVSKHLTTIDKMPIKENLQHVQKIKSDIEYMDKFSVAWAQKYYECCWRLWAINTPQSRADCTDMLRKFFIQLPYSRVLDNVDPDDVKEITALFNIALAMLRIAAFLWNPSEPVQKAEVQFRSYMEHINKFRSKPKQQWDVIQLIEMEALCHHINGLNVADPQEHRKRILPTLMNIYRRHAKIAEKITEPPPSVSPLYAVRTSAEIACHALLVLHLYLCNLSPLTWSPLFTTDDEDDHEQIPKDMEILVKDNQYRMKTLESLYKKLPKYSVLAALTALALAQFYRFMSKDTNKSEMAHFESVYIMDKTPGITDAIPCIRSDYGTNALIEYAEVLMTNNKYPLAALAYHSAVANHKFVHYSYDYKLIGKLADLSSKNYDGKRSIEYLMMLYKSYIEKGEKEKVVYLSEKLSAEYIERGDFKNAEECILSSVNEIRQMSGQMPFDYELQLQLKLAKLFLQGYYFERGIDLLAKVQEEEQLNQAVGAKCLVFTSLAEAYLKKRWLKECQFVLAKLGPQMNQSNMRVDANSVNEVKILELAAHCYYLKGRYDYALYWVNEAIERCDSSPPVLANLFYLKGLIFEAVSTSTSAVQFPTKLYSKNITKHPIYVQLMKQQQKPKQHSASKTANFQKRELYANAAEALQDALQSYKKAHYYYSAVSDELSLAKVNLRIAKAQLNYIFIPIAMMETDPDQCVNLPKLFSLATRIDLNDIDSTVEPILDFAVKTSNIILSMDACITLSELRFLQGRKHSSMAYWKECRNIFFTLFMDETDVVVSKGAPPEFLEKLLEILKRLIRLLFCYETDFINAHLDVIDAFLNLEIELEQVLKRPGEYVEQKPSEDIIGESKHDSDTSDEKKLVEENRIYQALPKNSSVTKRKSVPFLRHNSKSQISRKSLRKSKIIARRHTGSLRFGSQSSAGSDFDTMFVTERASEQVWSCLFRMKQHLAKYSSQSIDQQELSKRNAKCVKRLYTLMEFIRKQRRKGNDSSPVQSVTVHSLNERPHTISESNARDELLIIGGRGGKHKSLLGSPEISQIISNSPRPRPHSWNEKDTKAIKIEKVDTKLLLGKDGKNMTPEERHKTLLNSYLETIEEHEEKTPSFDDEEHKEEYPAYDVYWQPKQISEDMLSRLVYLLYIDDIIIYYIPKLGQRIFQKFGGRKDSPTIDKIGLIGSFSLIGKSASQEALTVKEKSTPWLSDEYESYLNALIFQGRKETRKDKNKIGVERTEQIVASMTQNLFKANFDYSAEEKPVVEKSNPFPTSKQEHLRTSTTFKSNTFSWRRKDFLTFPDLKDINITSKPLMLLASRWLQIFPWELMFKQLMVRTFSLQHLYARKAKQHNDKERCIPTYFAFYSEDEAKYIQPAEKQRKEWLFKYCRAKLNLTHIVPGILHDQVPNLPLHTPLVKYFSKPKKYKHKYKHVNFVKFSVIADNPTQIITYLESNLNSTSYPVFLFTISDLLDLSEVILSLLSFRPDCTLLFIAEASMITAVQILNDLQAYYLKNEQLSPKQGSQIGYKFFAHCIRTLQRELHIPVIVINPPNIF